MSCAKLVLIGLAAIVAVVHCDQYDFKGRPRGGPRGGPWGRRCGIPRCSEKLPAEVQAELKKIWETYKEGEDCTAQRAASKKLIDTLPEDVKAIIRPKGGRRCRAPRFLKKLSPDMQQKIETIWAGYKEGEDCQQQREATRTILETLTEEEWKELRPRGRGPGPHGPHGPHEAHEPLESHEPHFV